MRSVLLRLEGPLQSWGTQGRFSIRETDSEPSKSGVLGLVAAALGAPRSDTVTLAELATLRMAIRVDREGTIVDDYHTVGGGTFRGKPHELWGSKDTAITHRYYLADASFVVALGGDDHPLVDRIATALQDPVWPLFLGRKACVPSAPPYVGVRDIAPEQAVREAPWTEVRGRGSASRVRLVLETSTGRPRHDVPISFAVHDRRHGRRFVDIDWMDRPVSEIEEDSQEQAS